MFLLERDFNFMFTMENIISLDRVLPRDVVIPSVDDLLYEIGLCLTSVRERPKRRGINNPIVIAIVLFIMAVMKITSLIIDNEQWLIILGDNGRYFNMRVQWNLPIIMITMITLASQLVYYYNYKHNIN